RVCVLCQRLRLENKTKQQNRGRMGQRFSPTTQRRAVTDFGLESPQLDFQVFARAQRFTIKTAKHINGLEQRIEAEIRDTHNYSEESRIEENRQERFRIRHHLAEA